MPKGMHPDMSLNEILNSFIFITKGSCVINRHQTDWREASFLPRKVITAAWVYSKADMKNYFAHRVRQSKWDKGDPFTDWLKHPRRLTVLTLDEAMTLADRIARGLVPPTIDLAEMERRARAPSWVRTYSSTSGTA